MATNEEILKKLRELEEENERLKKAQETDTNLKVVEGEYRGHPTLTFHGPFKPFTLGVRKLSIIKQNWPDVESFLNRHDSEEVDDFKI